MRTRHVGARLGLVVCATLVFGLALMSSAIRWEVVPAPDTNVSESGRTSEEDGAADEGLSDVGSAEERGGSLVELPEPFEQQMESAQLTSYETHEPLEDAAQDLVERYERQGCCLMRHAGYLDLLGEVWSCVMVGPGWVDVCVVREGAGDEGSQVRISRLEVEAWEDYGTR